MKLSLVLASCAFQTSSQSADSAFFDASSFSFYVQFSVVGIVSYLPVAMQPNLACYLMAFLLTLPIQLHQIYDSLNFDVWGPVHK